MCFGVLLNFQAFHSSKCLCVLLKSDHQQIDHCALNSVIACSRVVAAISNDSVAGTLNAMKLI